MRRGYDNLQTEIEAIHHLQAYALQNGDEGLMAACELELDRIVPPRYRDMADLGHTGFELFVRYHTGSVAAGFATETPTEEQVS